MLMIALPPDLQAYLRQERRAKLEAAKVFARVCEESDAEQLYNAYELWQSARSRDRSDLGIGGDLKRSRKSDTE
jgi:hypothetical protein